MKSRNFLPAFLLVLYSSLFVALCGAAFGGGFPATPASAQEKPSSTVVAGSTEETTIPGPLRSFLRMAAISQQISSEEVLPLLARNIVVSGYQNGKPTQ